MSVMPAMTTPRTCGAEGGIHSHARLVSLAVVTATLNWNTAASSVLTMAKSNRLCSSLFMGCSCHE